MLFLPALSSAGAVWIVELFVAGPLSPLYPPIPVPAKVVITPVPAATLRITWLYESAI